MKKFFALVALLFPLFVCAQSVAINADGSLPHSAAILDIKSETKGMLVPRMTTIQRTSIPGPAIGLTVFDMDTYSYWMYRGDVNGGWAELQHNYQNYWDGSGLNIFNKNNGNVGIGTNSPTAKLSINGTDPILNLLNAGTAKGMIQLTGDHLKIGTYNSNADGNLAFHTKGLDRMTITATGNTGIGTTTPAGKFQIVGGTVASLNSNGFMVLGTTTATNMVFDNDEIMVRNNGANANLRLQNEGGNVTIGDATLFNSAHRLGVDGNTVITGNLRVGTTVTPSGYKLAVDGKAIFTEVLVRLVPGWPDYVFEKEHRLPTIFEVENYINTHKHLPGIPSAKEIESGGLNIGQMQKLQMEKIEELTLYIIELKKEIEGLKKLK